MESKSDITTPQHAGSSDSAVSNRKKPAITRRRRQTPVRPETRDGSAGRWIHKIGIGPEAALILGKLAYLTLFSVDFRLKFRILRFKRLPAAISRVHHHQTADDNHRQQRDGKKMHELLFRACTHSPDIIPKNTAHIPYGFSFFVPTF